MKRFMLGLFSVCLCSAALLVMSATRRKERSAALMTVMLPFLVGLGFEGNFFSFF